MRILLDGNQLLGKEKKNKNVVARKECWRDIFKEPRTGGSQDESGSSESWGCHQIDGRWSTCSHGRVEGSG